MEQKNKDLPAFSRPACENGYVKYDNGAEGLTKLEYFTASAIQGLLANGTLRDSTLVYQAIKIAHETLNSLENE